jgi:hypothetical protein
MNRANIRLDRAAGAPAAAAKPAAKPAPRPAAGR